MRSRILLGLCALLAGCGGGGGGGTPVTVPDPDGGQPPPTAPPTDPPVTPPADPGPPAHGLDPRVGQVVLKGSLGGGAGLDAPVALTLEAYDQQVALVTLTGDYAASAAPMAPMASLVSSVGTYSVMTIPTDGQPRSFAHRLKGPGAHSLNLYNRQNMETPVYGNDLTWKYEYDIRPLRDATEPTNDNIYTSDPLALNTVTARTFSSEGYPGVRDTLDNFVATLLPNKTYTFELSNTNDKYGAWTYSLSLVNPSWQPVQGVSAVTTTSTGFSYTFEGSSPRTLYLKVMGTPPTSASSFHYAQYWLKVTDSTIGAPVIDGVTPAAGSAGVEHRKVTFAPEYEGFANQVLWDFGGGASPNTATTLTPAVTLGERGSYTGTVTITNSAGTAGPFSFNYTVDPGTPIVQSIAPSGTLPVLGRPVDFSATVVGVPTAWSWEFGEGADPATSIEANPQVTFSTSGAHPISVTVSNDVGDSVRYTRAVTISTHALAPLIQFVDLPSGCAGGEGTFGATVTNDPTSWSWSFGEGASPSTSTAEQPSVTFPAPGLYNVSLTTANANGSSYTVTRAYSVDDPALVCWSRGVIDPTTSAGTGGSVTLLDGRPAVSYQSENGSLTTLRVALAQSATPTTEADWQTHTVHEGLYLGNFSSMVAHDGRLLVAYRGAGTLGNLWIARAQIAQPASSTDWTVHQALTTSQTGYNNTLTVVNEHPMVVTMHMTNTSARLAVARVTEPTTATDWSDLLVGGGRTQTQGYDPPDLIEHNARAWISYNDSQTGDLRIAQALTAIPAVDADITSHAVVTQGTVGAATSLLSVGGRLHVAYSVDSSAGGINMAVAQTATPTTPADWLVHAISPRRVSHIRMALVDGRPFLAAYGDFYGNGFTFLTAESAVPSPADAGDWSGQLHSSFGAYPTLTAGVTGVYLVSNDPATYRLGLMRADLN